jgi:hypothetical protein
MPSLLGNGKLNTLPGIHSTLQQYQADARELRMGDLNNRTGRCFLLGQPDVIMGISTEVSEYPVSLRSESKD